MKREKLVVRFKPQIIRANHKLGNFRQVTWIVGDGRSGTTWLAELINVDWTRRFMFEPFHPRYIEQMKRLSPYPYARPAIAQPGLMELAQAVFTGRFYHPLVDRADADKSHGRFWYKGLVIKDVFANLFIKWAIGQFPALKTIWLLRHPFAVALSKQKTNQRGWAWPSEPVELLAQAALYEDYLQPFAKLIQRADNDFTKQVTLWAILNYVPLQQLRAGEVLPVFYETLCLHPLDELQRIFAYLHSPHDAANTQAHTESQPGFAGLQRQASAKDWHKLAPKWLAQRNQPSYTSRRDGAAVPYQKLIGGWQQQLTQTEINAGLAILQAFGLDQVYQDHALPLRQAEELLTDVAP